MNGISRASHAFWDDPRVSHVHNYKSVLQITNHLTTTPSSMRSMWRWGCPCSLAWSGGQPTQELPPTKLPPHPNNDIKSVKHGKQAQSSNDNHPLRGCPHPEDQRSSARVQGQVDREEDKGDEGSEVISSSSSSCSFALSPLPSSLCLLTPCPSRRKDAGRISMELTAFHARPSTGQSCLSRVASSAPAVSGRRIISRRGMYPLLLVTELDLWPAGRECANACCVGHVG